MKRNCVFIQQYVFLINGLRVNAIVAGLCSQAHLLLMKRCYVSASYISNREVVGVDGGHAKYRTNVEPGVTGVCLTTGCLDHLFIQSKQPKYTTVH